MKSWTPTRLRNGEGCTSREGTYTRTGSGPAGWWARHAGRVIWAKGEAPRRAENRSHGLAREGGPLGTPRRSPFRGSRVAPLEGGALTSGRLPKKSG